MKMLIGFRVSDLLTFIAYAVKHYQTVRFKEGNS